MSFRGGPRIPVAVVREQLVEWIERCYEGPAAFDFDAIVDDYLDRFGPTPVDKVPAGAFVQIVNTHRRDEPAAGGCPSWCEMEPGHPYASEDDDGRQYRHHGRSLSEHVNLTVEECAGEPLFTRPIGLFVCVDTDAMTAAEVRQLAAELLDDTDELDKVTDSDQWTEDEL